MNNNNKQDNNKKCANLFNFTKSKVGEGLNEYETKYWKLKYFHK